MRLPLKSLVAGRSPEPLSHFPYAKVLLFVPVHLSPASLCRAPAGTALLLVWIFPVITQPWWQNGPLKLKGYGVPHLRSKRTPFVHLCVWIHVCYKGNVSAQRNGFFFLPDWVSLYVSDCVFVCYFKCVCVCSSMWWIMSLHNEGSY